VGLPLPHCLELNKDANDVGVDGCQPSDGLDALDAQLDCSMQHANAACSWLSMPKP
jgi:hypothetical protein